MRQHRHALSPKSPTVIRLRAADTNLRGAGGGRLAKENGSLCRAVRVMSSGLTRVQCERCGRYYDRRPENVGVRCQCPAPPEAAPARGLDLPRSKKAQANHRVTGDAANVNCPGCVRIMRETKAQLTAWTPSVEAP